MAKYRRKTATVEAVQFTRAGWNTAQEMKKEKKELSEDDKLLLKVVHGNGVGFSLVTAGGTVAVSVGDYIVRRAGNDVGAIKEDNFEDLYELAEPEKEKESEPPPAPPEKTAAEKAKELLNMNKEKK